MSHSQGITKYAVLMSHSEEISSKVRLLETIYASNRSTATASHAILLRWSHYCLVFVRFASIPVVGGIVIVALWPFAVWLYSGHLDYIIPIVLPFVPTDGNVVGATLVYAYQALLMVLAASGTCGADFMIVVLVLHLWPMCLIWQLRFGELNEELLVRPSHGNDAGSPAVRAFFRNLIALHKEMCTYLENIASIYYYMLLSEIFTCAQCLITILFCLNTVSGI